MAVGWSTRTARPRIRSQRQQKTTASIWPGRMPGIKTSRSRRWNSQQVMKLIESPEAITAASDSSTSKLLRLWRSILVDLCREDEVVLGQPAGDVGREVDGEGAVGEMKVGMVAFRLGDGGDLVDQLDARHEALELEGAAEDGPPAPLGEGPAVQEAELVAGLRLGKRRGVGGAPGTAPFGEPHLMAIVRRWVELGLPWAASSVGERLPHTQEVIGSNPMPPTRSSSRPRRLA